MKYIVILFFILFSTSCSTLYIDEYTSDYHDIRYTKIGDNRFYIRYAVANRFNREYHGKIIYNAAYTICKDYRFYRQEISEHIIYDIMLYKSKVWHLHAYGTCNEWREDYE